MRRAGALAFPKLGWSRADPRHAGAGQEAAQQQLQEQQRPVGGSPLKSAAAEVLRRAGRPMTAGEICRLALEWGLLSYPGRLPEASLASALCGDIKRQGRSSLFVRPQEGQFGLREWAAAQRRAPHGPSLTLPYPTATIDSGEAASSAAGTVSAGAEAVGTSNTGVQSSAQAPAQPAAQAATPKRLNPEPTAVGMASGRGPSRPKKARRNSEDGEEDWKDGASLGLSHREELDGSDDEGSLEPRQYSLRKGQVGRLQEAVETATAAAAAANSAAAAAGLSTAWNAPCLAFGQSAAAASAALPAPEPLDLPNLRPASAEGSGGQASTPHNRRPSSSGGGASLLSPPLHLVLQSPAPRPPGGSGNRGSLFSPCSGAPSLRSPLAAVPWLNTTPATLHNLLSPYGLASLGSNARQQQQAVSQPQRPGSGGSMRQAQASAALRGSAACNTAATAPVAPGTAGSVLMVPLREGAAVPGAANMSAQRLELPPIPPLNPGSHQRYGTLPFAAGQTPGGETGGLPALGFSFGGAGKAVMPGDRKQLGAVSVHVDTTGWPALSVEAVATGSFEIVPAPAGLAGGTVGTATGVSGAAAVPGTLPPATASIVQRVQEVQAKVQQVEAKWGALSLKTGQAYFLMAHACMHPQVAALFRAEAEAALRRSQDILQHNSVGLTAGQEDEYRSLLKSIRAAAGGSRAASGGPAGVAGAP